MSKPECKPNGNEQQMIEYDGCKTKEGEIHVICMQCEDLCIGLDYT